MRKSKSTVKKETNKSLLKEYSVNPSPKLKEKIYNKNIKLIHSVINKKFNIEHLKEDLFQEGSMALCRAIDIYNPEAGEFSTLSYYCIRNSLHNYLRKNKYINQNKQKNPDMMAIHMCDEEREGLYSEDCSGDLLEECLFHVSEEDKKVLISWSTRQSPRPTKKEKEVLGRFHIVKKNVLKEILF